MSNGNRNWSTGRFAYKPIRPARPSDKEIIDALVAALLAAQADVNDDKVYKQIDAALALARGGK